MSSDAHPRREIDRGLELLRRLVDWGHGESAPDMAVQDWDEARAWLQAVESTWASHTMADELAHALDYVLREADEVGEAYETGRAALAAYWGSYD